MGVPLKELKANFETDFRLHDAISSTCSMIRDFSVRQIYKHNTHVLQTLRDIC